MSTVEPDDYVVTTAEPEVVEDEVVVEEEREVVEEPEEDKVPKGVQKRIDQITREKHEEKRARERADADLDAIRRELEQLKASKQTEPEKTLPNGAPDPDKYPAGRYDPDYLEAVTDFKVQQRFEEQQIRMQAQERQQRLVALEDVARTEHPDYAEATKQFLQHPLVNVPQFREILIESENPAELSYYLGKNPDELDIISEMSPTQALRYIGKIEAKISSTPTEKSKPLSAASKPVTPLGSAKTSKVKSEDEMTMDEYAEWYKNRKKQK